MSVSVFDIFKIGIGPSSSHTLGPMIAARQFIDQLHNQNLFDQTTAVKISLYGSLALTGLGHATDKAVLLGLSGYDPAIIDPDKADETFAQIKKEHTLLLANSKEIPFDYDTQLLFHYDESLPQHPNGLRFYAMDKNGIVTLTKDYLSIGGGTIVEADKYQSNQNQNSEDNRQGVPFPFKTGKDLILLCNKNKRPLYELMMENEKALYNGNIQLINHKLDVIWAVMQGCIERGLKKEGSLPVSGVKRRAAEMYTSLLQQAESLAQDNFVIMDWITLYAMAVNEENACGGRIVTAPTNGGAGVLPAVLMYYLRFIQGASKQGVRDFLLTASAICMLYKMNASISGAEVGCQGEVGVACSMSAAALTAVQGGSIEQIENAAEIGMEHHLGMTCDPVGGLVQIPCIERNGIAAIKAITASRLALRGSGEHHVSLDSVIETMYRTGKDMQSKYRETSLGGLAIFARKSNTFTNQSDDIKNSH